MKILKICATTAPIIISLFALGYAMKANDTSRIIATLDLAPKIQFRLNFKTQKTTPYIFIKNIGPIEAIHITVELLELRYIPNPKDRLAALSGSEDKFNIPNLAPGKSYRLKIPEKWNHNHFHKLSKWANLPIEHFIIEAFISYRKEPDRKSFKFRVFYFFDKNGKIISESNAKGREEYKNMLAYLYKTKIDIFLIEGGEGAETDILHPVYE